MKRQEKKRTWKPLRNNHYISVFIHHIFFRRGAAYSVYALSLIHPTSTSPVLSSWPAEEILTPGCKRFLAAFGMIEMAGSFHTLFCHSTSSLSFPFFLVLGYFPHLLRWNQVKLRYFLPCTSHASQWQPACRRTSQDDPTYRKDGQAPITFFSNNGWS